MSGAFGGNGVENQSAIDLQILRRLGHTGAVLRDKRVSMKYAQEER